MVRGVFTLAVSTFLISLSLDMLSGSAAMALDTETLPMGVRMSQARFGIVSGLDQTWRTDGKLYDLGETRSISFDAATLARVNPRAKALLQALDFFGTQGLGSKINLGTLNVSTKPEVQYLAPVMAYGLSDKWTIGVGLPVIRYTNKISLSSTASNLETLRAQYSHVAKELDDALNVDLVAEAQKVIAEKGYRALANRDQEFLGDVELALLHKLPELGAWSLTHHMAFMLPTGPKDDPDDLMALNSFGRTAIENALAASRRFSARWRLVSFTSLLMPIPDRVTKRVPKNEDDLLPDPSSKAEVRRFIAPTVTLGGELHWEFLERWDVSGSLSGDMKGRDRYEGDGRMDLLASGSDSSAARVGSGLSYSTVEDYLRGRAKIPSRISLHIDDTVAGRNVERRLSTELSAMLFF